MMTDSKESEDKEVLLAGNAAAWWASKLPTEEKPGWGGRFFKTEEISSFLLSLVDAILAMKPEGYRNYIQIGHRSSYHAPKMINDLMEKTCGCSGDWLFPSKTEMKIYPLGYITINDNKIVYVDKGMTYLKAKDVDFSESFQVKVNRGKFRQIPINLNEFSGDLYHRYGKLGPHEFCDKNKRCDFLFARVQFKDFCGGEQTLRSLSDDELLSILSNKEKFDSHFLPNPFVHYQKKSPGENKSHFMDVGKLILEEFEPNYFQYTTGIIQAVHAPAYCKTQKCLWKRWDCELQPIGNHLLTENKEEIRAFGNDDPSLEIVYFSS